MRFSLLASCLATFHLVSSDPSSGPKPHKGYLADAAAKALVNRFVSLFVDFDEVIAIAILAPSFTEYSDSINFISPNNTKLTGDAVVSGLENFIAYRYIVEQNVGVGPNFDILSVRHKHYEIFFAWRQPTVPVPTQGYDSLEIDRKTGLIKAERTEFNTIAYLINAGCQFDCPPGPG